MTQPLLTAYQSQYYAWLLTRCVASDIVDSRGDLNPLQVEAALL